MNKTVELHSYWKLLRHLFPNDTNSDNGDSFLLSEYGIAHKSVRPIKFPYHVNHLKVLDESKFSVFMLKYPEHIKNIVYE